MRIGKLPVRIKKKGKTRGRPSNWEVHASKVMSEIAKSDAFKAEYERFSMEMFLHGSATLDTEKVWKEVYRDLL